MGRTFSPGDAWPSHPHKEWNGALGDARRHGWSLKRFDDHSWGRVSCPTGDCSVLIYSTALATENWARKTRRMVERCRHGGPAIDPLVKIADRLTLVERLLDACEQLAARDQAEEQIELLDQAADAVEETAQAFWDEFGELMQLADEAKARADEAFEAADVAPAGRTETLDAAEGHLDAAARDLEQEPRRASEVRKLWKRVARCRNRIESLRSPHLDAR